VKRVKGLDLKGMLSLYSLSPVPLAAPLQGTAACPYLPNSNRSATPRHLTEIVHYRIYI